nr:integrase, catalytic region, zinc finger, CCHC-type, peptidase aspartic, catalytic [Tanacetum cinerariifolium]
MINLTGKETIEIMIDGMIKVAGSENRPTMLNKENYVPWSSRLLRYAKSKPNGKFIHNSIINGPYVRRMIHEPSDTNREVPVTETFHVQIDDELTKRNLNRLKPMIKLFRPFFSQMMKGSDIGIQEKKAKLFNEWESTSPRSTIIQSEMQQPMPNPKDITDPTTTMNMALALMAKAFKLNYSTPTNNNQRISLNPHNRHIAQPGMNMGQDRQMQMVGGNCKNQFRQYVGQNVGNLNRYNGVQNVRNQVIQNAIQNLRVQNIGNQNGLIGVSRNANQNLNGNGNLVVARAEGHAAGHNRNQMRCNNCRGVGHFFRNYTVRPRRMDVAYLQTQLLIAQKEEAGIQLQAEEFDLMAAATDLDEIEKVNENCILMANLQQASTSGPQTDRAPVYDSNGSAEFLGTVRFGNDHVAVILGFNDLQWGNILITKVAFRRNACFVRNLEGVDLLFENRTTNLYTINLHDMASASPICLMARASSTKSWLWHQRLSHLNFDTINDLAKNDLVSGLPKFKYHKEHLFPSLSSVRTPQQNRVVEPRNQTLVEAARTMLIFSHAPLFLWAKAIATAYSLKTASSFIVVLTKHHTSSLAVENRISLSFMYSELSVIPKMIMKILGSLVQKVILAFSLAILPIPVLQGELDLLFEAMYDDYIGGQPSAAQRSVSAAQAHQDHQTSTTSTSIADTAPTPTNSYSQATDFLNSSQDIDGLSLQQQQAQQQGTQASLQSKTVADNVPNAMFDAKTLVNPFATTSTSATESSSSSY